jgi:hypothetical protein
MSQFLSAKGQHPQQHTRKQQDDAAAISSKSSARVDITFCPNEKPLHNAISTVPKAS